MRKKKKRKNIEEYEEDLEATIENFKNELKEPVEEPVIVKTIPNENTEENKQLNHNQKELKYTSKVTNNIFSDYEYTENYNISNLDEFSDTIYTASEEPILINSDHKEISEPLSEKDEKKSKKKEKTKKEKKVKEKKEKKVKEKKTKEKKEKKVKEKKPKKEKTPIKTSKIKKIINIIFIILIALISMISIDIVCVSKYNKGPFFAIRTKVYKDGGTKVYYGLGYKVIKYHQLQGRRDMKIGFWNMPYSIEATTLSDIDLAIELRNNYQKTYKKYYKQFLRINTTLHKVNIEDNKITVGYKDPNNKYTTYINCKMADSKTNISDFAINKKITIIGTLNKVKIKNKKQPFEVTINDCFAEQ